MKRRIIRDPNRRLKDAAEAKLARLVGRLLAEQRRRVFAFLELPAKQSWWPTTEFWNEQIGDWLEAVRPLLRIMGLESARRLLGSTGPRIDPEAAANRVIEYIDAWSFDLIRGITDTSRELTRAALEAYAGTPGMTRQDLVDMLNPIWGADRAQRIAVTETTRAYAEGDRLATQELRDRGWRLKDIWQTNHDDLVCDDCGPFHNQEVTDIGDRPPLHVNCRCWIVHEVT